jgi:hypothetical protein
MATIVVTSILAVACIFMVYVLVQFHLEAKRRPRRTMSHRPKGVIAFRKIPAEPNRHQTGQRPDETADSLGLQTDKTNKELAMVIFPAGIRRLATKRVGRS